MQRKPQENAEAVNMGEFLTYNQLVTEVTWAICRGKHESNSGGDARVV
jgi:hypothetical protein